jgi:hypothetical protein
MTLHVNHFVTRQAGNTYVGMIDIYNEHTSLENITPEQARVLAIKLIEAARDAEQLALEEQEVKV